jgi:hypothetical protein
MAQNHTEVEKMMEESGMKCDSKKCELCNAEFSRPLCISNSTWDGRRFCSKGCATKARWIDSAFTRTSTPLEERFWQFVTKKERDQCWEWAGSQDGRGYGQLSAGKNKSPIKAHKLSWMIHFGIDADDLEVCHACDNRICVNPYHLMLGTRTANMVDASRKGQLNRSKNNGQ